FGTLDIQEILTGAEQEWPVGSGLALAASSLLLAGAVGKSAQLPLQTWLPDAMAGPTPVSALIHAATMVTAGMYLIARMHTLFVLAPAVQLAVAVVGAVTLLLAAFAALSQRDIKRILAYSTMSQIGYMFLALGVGAWSAAVFHFMTHAFFKALLFLAAGALILAMHHEQDIFRMGGLRRRLPLVFWTFLIGSAALASVPLVTSGFYSKEQILAGAWSAERGAFWLGLAGLVAAFLTSVYIFRAVFIVFFGAQASAADRDDPIRAAEDRTRAADGRRTRLAISIPLVVLAVLSIVGGFVETPASLGHVNVFSGFMESALPETADAEGGAGEIALELAAAVISLAGIALAYWLFFPGRRRARQADSARVSERPPWPLALDRLWASGWGFDRLYDLVFVTPFMLISSLLRGDLVDRIYDGIAAALRFAWRGAADSQTGELRWYAAGMLAGLVIVIAVALLL